LGRSRSRKLAIGLRQVFGKLDRFRRRTSNHYPECKIHFQRDQHRGPPAFFDFRVTATIARNRRKLWSKYDTKSNFLAAFVGTNDEAAGVNRRLRCHRLNRLA
jgi:hypothetical protein